MFFGVVFMEKNTKNKKKRSIFENLLPHISTTGALWDMIPTDSGSYISGLQFTSFDHFKKLVM
jgi:hypothetical protein